MNRYTTRTSNRRAVDGIVLFVEVSQPFSIDIRLDGQLQSKENASARRALAAEYMFGEIGKEISRELPTGHRLRNSLHEGATINMYRTEVSRMAFEIILPKTAESEELAMLWLLSGRATQIEPVSKW